MTSPFPITPFLRVVLSPFAIRYIAIGGLEALQAAAGMLSPLALGILVQKMAHFTQGSSAAGASSFRDIGCALLFFVATITVDMLCSRGSGALFIHALAPQRHAIAMRLHMTALARNQDFHNQHPASLVSQRVSETAVAINQLLGTVFFDFWPTIIALALAAITLCTASPYLGGFMVCWVLLYGTASYRLARKAEPLIVDAAGREAQTNAQITDSLTNQISVTLANGTESERRHIALYQTLEYVAIARTNRFFERLRWGQFGFMAIFSATVPCFASWLFVSGRIDLALFTMSVGIVLHVVNYTHNLSQRLIDCFNYYGKIVDGVTHLLPAKPLDDPKGSVSEHPDPHMQASGIDTKGAPTDPSLARRSSRGPLPSHPPFAMQTSQSPHQSWPADRPLDIIFDGVHYALADRTILGRIDLTIRAGERVAIVGPSGAGKSTFLQLILGIIAPTEGRVLAAGRDMRSISPACWRAHIAAVPQQGLLFNRSVEENVCYAMGGRSSAADVSRQGGNIDSNPSAASDYEACSLYAALRSAQALSFVSALPDGLSTVVGAEGNKLSGGEMQRLLLARAFARHASIIVLDEATAHLDPITETAVCAQWLPNPHADIPPPSHATDTAPLESVVRDDATVLFVSHRIERAAAMPRILVVVDGRVVADGGHAALLKDSADYRLLWEQGKR